MSRIPKNMALLLDLDGGNQSATQRRSGISQPNISRMIAGSTPKLATLNKVTAYFGVSAEEFQNSDLAKAEFRERIRSNLGARHAEEVPSKFAGKKSGAHAAREVEGVAIFVGLLAQACVRARPEIMQALDDLARAENAAPLHPYVVAMISGLRERVAREASISAASSTSRPAPRGTLNRR